jgi:hypothetical protein
LFEAISTPLSKFSCDFHWDHLHTCRPFNKGIFLDKEQIAILSAVQVETIWQFRVDQVGLKKRLQKHEKEIEEKAVEISQLKELNDKAREYASCMMACRPLARVYTLYLREKWYNCFLERIALHLPTDIGSPADFIAIF